MKYALFIWEQYEARGGWSDYAESFNDIEVAKEYLIQRRQDPRHRFWEFGHVVDLESHKIVCEIHRTDVDFNFITFDDL